MSSLLITEETQLLGTYPAPQAKECTQVSQCTPHFDRWTEGLKNNHSEFEKTIGPLLNWITIGFSKHPERVMVKVHMPNARLRAANHRHSFLYFTATAIAA